MNRRWTSDQTATRARQRDAGIARGPGLLVAAVTAAIVFAIGLQVFPVKPKQPPAPPPAPAPVAQTPPPAPVADAATAVATSAAMANVRVIATPPRS